MIEENTTWQLGTVDYGENYRLTKYQDVIGSTLITNTTVAKVGLLRLGELMAGQFDLYTNTTTYLLLTSSESYVRTVNSRGYNGDSASNDLSSFSPTMNLKSDVVITGGIGTKEEPFQLALKQKISC